MLNMFQRRVVAKTAINLFVVTYGSDELFLYVNESSLRSLAYVATVLACLMLTVL